MPKFKISSPSAHNSKTTFERVCKLLDEDKDLRSYDSKYSCNFNDETLTGNAKGNFFEASWQVTGGAEGGSSAVEITVSLPLKLALFKGKIEKSLQSKVLDILKDK